MASTNDIVIPVDSTESLIKKNSETNWPDLSDQRKAFAYEYVANGYKHRAAAKKAGFAENSGISLVREPLLSAFIAYIQERHFTSQIITKQFVEHQYLELIPYLKGEETIPIVTGQGIEIEACKFHGSELVAVLRDLSKVTGYQKEDEGSKGLVNIEMNFGAVMDSPEVIINGRG